MSIKNTIKQDNKVYLFKFGGMPELLNQINDRLYLIDKVSPVFKNIEGVNIIAIWEELFSEIHEKWDNSDNELFIILDEVQEIKLIVIADIFAVFFMFNGDERDDDFLNNMGGFFKDINKKYHKMSQEQRFDIMKGFILNKEQLN